MAELTEAQKLEAAQELNAAVSAIIGDFHERRGVDVPFVFVIPTREQNHVLSNLNDENIRGIFSAIIGEIDNGTGEEVKDH